MFQFVKKPTPGSTASGNNSAEKSTHQGKSRPKRSTQSEGDADAERKGETKRKATQNAPPETREKKRTGGRLKKQTESRSRRRPPATPAFPIFAQKGASNPQKKTKGGEELRQAAARILAATVTSAEKDKQDHANQDNAKQASATALVASRGRDIPTQIAPCQIHRFIRKSAI